MSIEDIRNEAKPTKMDQRIIWIEPTRRSKESNKEENNSAEKSTKKQLQDFKNISRTYKDYSQKHVADFYPRKEIKIKQINIKPKQAKRDA